MNRSSLNPESNMPNLFSLLRRKVPRHFPQVMATLAVSLGPFAAGLGKGYSSPALASLQESKTSTFHVSAQEGSWVASLSLLGALFGCLVGGLMMQVGRRRSLLLIALPFSGSWLLTVFAQRVEMMYSTSFIGGFFSAVTLLATQVYVSEIAHPEIRGCLSAVLKMAGEIGTLTSFTLGAFLDWRQLATIAAGGPILFFLAILFIPETPSFLLYNGQEKEARSAMTWLRSDNNDVASEIETLRKNISAKHKTFFPLKSSTSFPFRQLFITCGLMFFQKFSGVTVFHHYAVPIFKQVFGRSIDAHWAAIVVVFLRLLGSMTSGLLIDTAGRLPLLIISNLFISGGFFGFGLYTWMEESLPPKYPGFGPSMDWIPLTCVLFFTLFFSIGIGPISWLMVGELFPLEYRGFGSSVSTSFSYMCAFAAVKTYVDIKSQVGLHGAFWIYSGISIAGLIFVCCLVPETKGIGLEEMHFTTSPSPPNTYKLPTNSSVRQTPEYPPCPNSNPVSQSHNNYCNHNSQQNANPIMSEKAEMLGLAAYGRSLGTTSTEEVNPNSLCMRLTPNNGDAQYYRPDVCNSQNNGLNPSSYRRHEEEEEAYYTRFVDLHQCALYGRSSEHETRFMHRNQPPITATAHFFTYAYQCSPHRTQGVQSRFFSNGTMRRPAEPQYLCAYHRCPPMDLGDHHQSQDPEHLAHKRLAITTNNSHYRRPANYTHHHTRQFSPGVQWTIV